jgi:large subunit ribosomal protein L25
MAKNPANNLTATVRTELGKGASRRARREGRVPVVLYGHGTDPQHLELDSHDFAAVLRNAGTNAVLSLQVAGKEQLALTKSIEIHPIRRNIQHADLLVVKRGEKVTVEVTVVVEGDAAPGTLVTQEQAAIEIEADALSIPQQFTVSVEEAQEGTQILAGQIELPSGVTLVSDPELLVVNVITAPTEEELEAEGGGASLEEQAAEFAEAVEEAEAEAEGGEEGDKPAESE